MEWHRERYIRKGIRGGWCGCRHLLADRQAGRRIGGQQRAAQCRGRRIHLEPFLCGTRAVVRKQVSDGELKAVILNSGGANACTGEEGYQQTVRTAEAVALMMHVEPSEIAVCSTGLIGELLPLDKVIEGAQKAFDSLDSSAQAGSDAAHAIMTTDTKPKTVNRLGSNEFRIGGMVKGSGMIAPQLATMLCVITTDAVVSAGQLQAALTAAVDRSFNRIDVDGCMSTNDTVLLLASGASGITPPRRIQRLGGRLLLQSREADHR